MLKRIQTRPEPQLDEAADYIRDTLVVLARLADDIKLSDLAGRLRTAFREPVSHAPPNWKGQYNRGRRNY